MDLNVAVTVILSRDCFPYSCCSGIGGTSVEKPVAGVADDVTLASIARIVLGAMGRAAKKSATGLD